MACCCLHNLAQEIRADAPPPEDLEDWDAFRPHRPPRPQPPGQRYEGPQGAGNVHSRQEFIQYQFGEQQAAAADDDV